MTAQRYFAVASLALVFAALAPSAFAQDDFFEIQGMTDFDQSRSDLPQNGDNYCVPTSNTNILQYLGTHGVSALKIDPASYNNVTDTIDLMGSYMATDAANGTNQDNAQLGFKSYVSDHSNIAVTYKTYYRDKAFMSPNVWLQWMKLGGLTTLCYGFYSNPHGEDKERKGGHCLTLVSVRQTEHDNPFSKVAPWIPSTFKTYQVGFKNPASDEGADDPNRLETQSVNATDLFDLHIESANFDEDSTTLYGVGDKPDGNGATYAYIDKYQAILPQTILKLTGGYKFRLQVALHFDPLRYRYNPAETTELAYQVAGDPRGDYALDPVAPAFIRTQTGSKRIYQTDIFGKRSRIIGSAKNLILNLEYAGPDLDLFVLERDRLQLMHRDGSWGATARFNFAPEAMAYDKVHGYLYVVGGSELVILNRDLRKLKQQSFRELLTQGSDRQFLRCDDTNGDIYSLRRGSDTLLKFTMTDHGVRFTRSIALDGLNSSRSFDIAPNGHVMVSDNGFLREFLPTGRQIRTSPFAGSQVGDNFRMSKDFSNFDERRYPTSKWHDVANPQEPLGKIR